MVREARKATPYPKELGGSRPASGPLLPLLLAAALCGLLLAPAPCAAGPGMSACMDCHEDQSLTKDLANGEVLPLRVDAAEFEASAHGTLSCRECHPAVNLDDHPGERDIASREAYRAEVSRNCLRCHRPEKLGRRPQHAALVFEDQQLACVECHGAHAVQRVASWKRGGSGNEYCLRCHSRDLALALPGGRLLSLRVDTALLAGSVHSGHDCTDCHSAYGTDAHPSKAALGRSERALAASRVCAACHEDKFQQVEGSIHYTLLAKGVDAAPGCTACHSAHGVTARETYDTMAGVPCRTCHAEIFRAYAASMHGDAKANGGHLEAPLCTDCHQAHGVEGMAASERIRQACIGCHPAAGKAHAAWLPNAALHLDAVSCAACHAPASKRLVVLRLVDERTGRPLGEQEMAQLLGPQFATRMDALGDGMDPLELWNLLREVGRQPNAPAVALTGRMEVARGTDAHRLAHKGDAVRQCESCHRHGSASFDEVAVKLATEEGRAARYQVSPAVLGSVLSAVPLRAFYALGSTRHEVLDWMLVLAVLGGLVVPVVHGGARIWTSRKRKGE